MSKMLKRVGRTELLALLVAALMTFALTGCSGGGSSTPTGVSNPLAQTGQSGNDDGTLDQGGGNPDDAPGDDNGGSGLDDGTLDQGGGGVDDPPGDDKGGQGQDDGLLDRGGNQDDPPGDDNGGQGQDDGGGDDGGGHGGDDGSGHA